jgi:hypothetical protein
MKEYRATTADNGRPPDKDFFKPKKEQARILQTAENKALTCRNCAFTFENQA